MTETETYRSYPAASRPFLGIGRSFLGINHSFLGINHSFLGINHSFLGIGRSFLFGKGVNHFVNHFTSKLLTLNIRQYA
jgi:hypothetical protein